MKYVTFLFHIYQPPVQSERQVTEIAQQSYEPLTRIIKEFGDLKLTINVNYSLVELLHFRFPHIIQNIRSSFESGALELTATGAYHPVFPLIPSAEVDRQIKINQLGNQRLLSASFKPKGIFPPELAFDGRLASTFRSLGFEWTIADDSGIQTSGSEIPYNRIYDFGGIAVFLRSNYWANKFANYDGRWKSGKDCVADLLDGMSRWMGDDDGYVIVALDGETFGHHHPSLNDKFIRGLFEALRGAREHLQTAHLSFLLTKFPRVSHFVPPGSWSTDSADRGRQDYFSWWKSIANPVHQLQWKLVNLVLQKVRAINHDELNQEMDKALYSCQFWWASYWKFNPGEIYRGAFNVMRILQWATDVLHQDDQMFDQDTDLREGEILMRQLVTEVECGNHKRD